MWCCPVAEALAEVVYLFQCPSALSASMEDVEGHCFVLVASEPCRTLVPWPYPEECTPDASSQAGWAELAQASPRIEMFTVGSIGFRFLLSTRGFQYLLSLRCMPCPLLFSNVICIPDTGLCMAAGIKKARGGLQFCRRPSDQQQGHDSALHTGVCHSTGLPQALC